MAYILATEKSYDYIKLKVQDLDPGWTQEDGNRRIDIFYKGENESDYTEYGNGFKLTYSQGATGSSNEYNIPLKSSMTYDFKVEIFKWGETWEDGYEPLMILYGKATTFPKPPTVNVTETSADYVKFEIIDMRSSRGSLYQFHITITDKSTGISIYDNDYTPNNSLDETDGVTLNLYYEKWGISQGSTYEIKVYGIKELANGDLYFNTDYCGIAFFTAPSKDKPDKFYWSAYGAIPEASQEISNILHTAWNSLAESIKEMIAYTGNDAYMPDDADTYGNARALKYSQAIDLAIMDGSDNTLYAYKFNIINYIIQNISGYITWIDNKQSGNDVFASYLTALQDNFNMNL